MDPLHETAEAALSGHDDLQIAVDGDSERALGPPTTKGLAPEALAGAIELQQDDVRPAIALDRTVAEVDCLGEPARHDGVALGVHSDAAPSASGVRAPTDILPAQNPHRLAPARGRRIGRGLSCTSSARVVQCGGRVVEIRYAPCVSFVGD